MSATSWLPPGRPSDIATTLLAGKLSPQELGLTNDGIDQLMEVAEPNASVASVVTEALEVVARAIRQPNNAALAAWLAQAVLGSPDRQKFLAHVRAVNQLYAVIVALRPTTT